MGCGHRELGDCEVYLAEHASHGKGLWCHCDSLWWQELLHLDWECQLQDLGHLLQPSHSCLVIPPLLVSANGDWAQDSKQAHECLLLWEMGLVATGISLRPALVMHWLSSACNSALYPSCCQQGTSLGVRSYSPQYTSSMIFKISLSDNPSRLLTKGWIGAISSAISGGGNGYISFSAAASPSAPWRQWCWTNGWHFEWVPSPVH